VHVVNVTNYTLSSPRVPCDVNLGVDRETVCEDHVTKTHRPRKKCEYVAERPSPFPPNVPDENYILVPDRTHPRPSADKLSGPQRGSDSISTAPAGSASKCPTRPAPGSTKSDERPARCIVPPNSGANPDHPTDDGRLALSVFQCRLYSRHATVLFKNVVALFPARESSESARGGPFSGVLKTTSRLDFNTDWGGLHHVLEINSLGERL